MKKFIKENWFKLSILAILLIVILIAVYYFLIFLPKKSDVRKNEQGVNKHTEEKEREIKVKDDFFLKDGRKLKVVEVEVGNYYVDNSITQNLMRAQVGVRINSDDGPLSEEEYNKMYILKGNQLIKLSNSLAADHGRYWFEMPKTSDFDGMKLYFGDEATVTLTPYIKTNNF